MVDALFVDHRMGIDTISLLTFSDDTATMLRFQFGLLCTQCIHYVSELDYIERTHESFIGPTEQQIVQNRRECKIYFAAGTFNVAHICICFLHSKKSFRNRSSVESRVERQAEQMNTIQVS